MNESHKAVEDVDLTPPEAVKNAAQAAIDFEDENDDIQDCGTGVGDKRARQIINEELSPEDFLGGENTAIPDYLESHEEDVTAEGPATDWSDEEMDDCGNRQYAKWGGTGTGTGLEWAKETERKLQEAQEEDENNAMSNNSSSKEYGYEIGDFVSWEFGDGESQGEITERTDEEGDTMSAGGNEFTVDDSENPLYKIKEWDESEGEDGEFTNNVVKFEEAISSAERPEEAPESANSSDTRRVNQLSTDELKDIASKAGTEEAPKVHKGFQIDSKDVKVGEDEDGNPVYKVPISGDAQDRDLDQMAIEGQEHMVEQLRTGKIPVFGDHGRAADAPRYSFTNIIGQFIDGELSNIQDQERNEGEKVTMAKLRPDMAHPDAERLVHLLENDFPVGFSVGFRPLEVEEVRNDDGELVGLKMLKIDLMEASAVGIPSQPDSVPVGISNNSTEAAVAVKSYLDEKDGQVDVEDLKEALENNISEDKSMGDEPEDDGKDGSAQEPDKNDDTENPEEKNDQAEQVKDLVKEALEEHERDAPHYAKTLEEALKDVEKFEGDELEEIMNVVGTVISNHMDAAMEDIADQLEADSSDEENSEEPSEQNESDEDEEEEEEEENSDEPDEENGLDDDDKTGAGEGQDPKGTGPMTTGDGKGEDPEEVDVAEGVSDDEIEDLAFGGTP